MTNGLGGYACGTVALANTRRYHAFLMASLAPPVQRTLLVAKIDLSVEYLGVKTDLGTNEFAGGAITPQGFIHLESFAVLDGIPTWRYAVADAEKGKPSTGVAVYVALLWVCGLIDRLSDRADPGTDDVGTRLARMRESARAPSPRAEQ